ncbi:conjugal transfer protein TraG N-terminal domain-containing protein [Burkholderia multivorans]|uniref:conjugal transfer protein TraG N-terminal domain-containing protein n=1 Tax=Burkholderia multivorans TaxID=87883 RepID=UPI0028704DD5|nr:conjugal transfer protein TraG N-terminal domain-containing protein [Burkholderia multivorans]
MGSLQITTNYLLGVSQSAQNILRQAIVGNTIIDAEYTIPSQVGDAAQAQVKLAGAQAIRSFNTSYGTMAALADETMPKLRNAVEILTYAMFPIVVLIIVVSGQYALTFLKTYVGALLWVQLWPPLYAVTNFIMNTKAASGLGSATGGNGLALKYYNYLGASVASDQAIAGVLAIAIPVIAYGIVQATMAAANSVVSSVTAGGAYGASLSQGNLTMGAANVDTTKAGLYTAGLYNMQPMLKGGVPNSMVAGEQGTVAQEGLIYRFSGSWGQASALDSNRDGRITVDEITSFQGLGSSMFGGKAGLSLGQSRSDGIYSDESVQAGKGRASSLGDTQTARLTREQGAAWGRTFTQALNDEVGRETGGGVTTAAGHSSNTGSETTGQKSLRNQEGAGVNSGVGTGVGTASHGTPQTGSYEKAKNAGKDLGLRERLAEKIGNALAFSVSGDVRTGQEYAEQATQLMKTMSQDDVRKSYDIVSRALKKTAGSTSDQGMRQATERMAAALDKAKTFDSKELASIMEQASAGNRRDVTSRNAAEVSSDSSRELFKTAWMMLASHQGWDDTVTTERLATFAREWNSNASFREDAEVAMLERLKGNSLMQTGVRDPLGQDELRNRGDVAVNALGQRGRVAIEAQNDRNAGEVVASQFADPRSMPSIAPAAQGYAQVMSQANGEVQGRAAQMHLEQGINTTAAALYHDRQKGELQVLLNTYGFGAGSASPQEYAAKLREAAAKDPELARGLATIGMNHEQAKIGPTEQNLEWVLHKAGRSVAEAEGKGATAAYEVAGVWRWAKGLFSEEPVAPSELGGPLSGTPGSSNLGKLLGGNQRQMPTQAQPTEGADSQQKAGNAPPPGNR